MYVVLCMVFVLNILLEEESMKFIVSKLGKKAVSIICVLSILLSVVGVAFGTFASGGSEAAYGIYTVDADTAPAIPMFSLTQVDLAETVEVKFAGDTSAVSGADITWTLLEGGESDISIEGAVIFAQKSGTYKIKAESGDKSATLWIVVANKGDDAWNIYNFDFDEYAEQNELNKLTFEEDGNYTSVPYKEAGVAIYRTGAFKYDGVAFDQSNIPDAVKPIEGWSAWYKGFMNRSGNGVSNYIEVPFLMPYKHTGTSHNIFLNRAVNSGVMPFDNPYMTGALGLNNDDQLIDSVSNGESQMRGFYILNNEVVNAFLDYTVTADMDMTTFKGYDGAFAPSGYNGVFGRLRTDAAGNPSTTPLTDYTSAPYYTATFANSTTNIIAENNARTDISNVLFGVNIYSPTAADQIHRGSSVAKVEVDKNAFYMPVTVAGSNVSQHVGSAYYLKGTGQTGADVSHDNWDYIKNKGYLKTSDTGSGVNVVLSVKYSGTTATVFSPENTDETFTFDNVPTTKGNVGVWTGNITRRVTTGATTTGGSWLNIHNFRVSLNNDITAENNGTQYPYYSERETYKILKTNPALAMYTGTYVSKADFAVQCDDDSLQYASDLTFTFKNLDSEGNVLDTPVIGVKDDVEAGRIYAYKKGAYKAIISETATGNKVAEIWVAVKDNKGDDWVLYDIDFDKIAADNDYGDFTFVESGETATVQSANGNANKEYITGSYMYKGEEVTHSNVPDALKHPAGWSTVIRGADWNVQTHWSKVPYVMPYSHTAAEGVTPSYTRTVTTGLMPFDNPFAANGLGFDLSDKVEVSSILSQSSFTQGYFILSNDITKAFTDYKITADMDMASFNNMHGIFNSIYNLGIVGRLPVDEDSIPTDEVFSDYTITDKYTGSSFNNVTYSNTQSTGYTSTAFLVNLEAGNKHPCTVAKVDSYWHKVNRWIYSGYVPGVSLKDGSPLQVGVTYPAADVTVDSWKYLMDKNWRGDMKTGANVVLSVLYKGNSAEISSPEDTAGKTYKFDNVYSTTGAVGVVAPVITSLLDGSKKGRDYEWVSMHRFTIALANSDDDVPPYKEAIMLSEERTTLSVTVNKPLALSQIAITFDDAIFSGADATWSFDSADVSVAGGNLTATKSGYYAGNVVAGGKSIDIIVEVKQADGSTNTLLTEEDNIVYITKDVQIELDKYTLLVDGKYFSAADVTAVPEANSEITIADGKLTAAKTGYQNVTFTTAAGDITIVFVVMTDKYYDNENYSFEMSADYIGSIGKYSIGGWNDNILISVDRADSEESYSQVLTIPDRIYNHYVEGDWVNIYTVGDLFNSGDYAKNTKYLIVQKYIEKIGASAFANFTNLESLELSERLKEIGDKAFENDGKLKEITLPATLTSIGANAFSGCVSLTDVWVMNPDSVTIGNGAFPEGVTVHVIGGSAAEEAFKAAGYTTVALDTDKADAFTKEHDKIVKIEADRENKVDVGTWYECTESTDKQIKGLEYSRFALNDRDAGVLEVPAEYKWTNAKGETDEYPMNHAGINAFSKSFERNRIYEIVFPQIEYQFQFGICEQMSNLKKVTLPTGLISLRQYDFAKTAIKEIVIPTSVETIDYNGYVFTDCENLEKITFETASRTSMFGGNNISGTKIETLDLPVSVEQINTAVADNATNLKRINFYNKDAALVVMRSQNVYRPDDKANYLPEGITIGCIKGGWMDAYAQKYNIPVVYLDDPLDSTDSNPASYVVTTKDKYNAITDYVGIGGKLVIPANADSAEEKNAPIYIISKNAFEHCLNRIRAVEISEGIVSIGDNVFADTPNLESVKLPNSLKEIGKEAFSDSGITGTLEIPKNVTTVSSSAFKGNKGITDVYFYNANTEIGDSAIPQTAIIHGIKGSTAEAYAQMMNMQFVEIPAPSRETISDATDNKNYKFTVSEDGVLTGYERIDDSKPYSLKVTIPAEVNGVKVTAVSADLFETGSEASSVYAIEIAEGIKTINDNAFKNNIKLTHVKVPKTLEKIGESAFEGTTLIGDIELGEGFKELGANAFKNVKELTSITILNKACVINASALPQNSKNFTLYGYNNSTAMTFAQNNSIPFVLVEENVIDTPSTGGNTNTDNTQKPIDGPQDVGGKDSVIYQYVEEDITMVIILATAMLILMLLVSGGIVAFVIIKSKKQY